MTTQPSCVSHECSTTVAATIDAEVAIARRKMLATEWLGDTYEVCASRHGMFDRIERKLHAPSGCSLDDLAAAAAEVLGECSRAPIGDRPLRGVTLLEMMFEFLQQRAGMTFQQACCAVHEWREQYL